MNNTFVFKILYYVCFLVLLFLFVWIDSLVSIFGYGLMVNFWLGVFNLVLTLVFSIKLIKGRLENVNIFFPILNLVFLLIVVLLMFVINDKLILPYIHFNYYFTFILFNFLLLNMYSVLSFSKNKTV